ncbi:MlaD family protein [Gordonia westfalica]|uniref:Phospholipid/cholesterol/gamma-HCH transport system substrate-binding protein n=1 Tax=Gordonia westfalica TaxID=158898 RepID=A0A1H2KLQ4_9ACTN|nr:MlaD family protein [Gordonia westfalica]SDU69335.1 phospholipid/cholesterol/gamma-HCH transport system substrate-binding protein [Gordonia westfalica]
MNGRFAGAARIMRPLWKLIAAAAVAAILFAAITNGIKNPVDGTTAQYTADFTDASGLRPNADVRIRGVKVGKVTAIEMRQSEDAAHAEVSFTLLEPHKLTDQTKAAVKYANLSGVRYVDVTGVDGQGESVTHLPVKQTIPSFDITELFNGLQPVLQTLSPQEINSFSQNALTLLQGDGGGLAPMLKSVDTLSRYATDRQQVISVLVANMSRISDTLGGKSPQILEFLRDIEGPVDSTLTVLDEFRKASEYGPSFMGVLNSILSGVGIQPDTDVDRILTEAFPTVDNLWRSLEMLPTMLEGLQSPVTAPMPEKRCSKAELALPAMAKVLINGSGVVICRA